MYVGQAVTDTDTIAQTGGQNVAGESPEPEPESVDDDTTVHDDDTELE